MIRRPPRSTLSSSSAASDVYKRQAKFRANVEGHSRRREKGMEKQSMIEADRVDWCSALDHNWEVRKAHVDDVQQAQRDTAELLAEANAMRMEAHAANLDRIRRAEAYNQRVRKAVVQAQDEHIDMKKRADSDQRSLLKQSRVVIEKQQETMLVSLEQIRARGDGVPEDPDELRRLVEEQEAIQKGVVMSNISISRSHRNSSVSKPTTLAPLSTTTPPPPRASTTTEYYAGGADPSETTTTHNNTCLLYTSDAADEEDSVDLGGRRIIKKKKNKSHHNDKTPSR
eukprot:TRINITY_DN20882_c0_g1_i4.p1 TRINITY_DN20882_c0_g1~~TRINITY_DN20882_c0_g1_i4.p1  ORF type:complete len:284 (-),score=72.57 TRINITY_DN20882_c0_g1_i4:21-872(-)